MSGISQTINSPDSYPSTVPAPRPRPTLPQTKIPPLPAEVIRALRAEQERRRIARLDLTERRRLADECQGSFLAFATQALRSEGYAPAAHHRLLIENLED